MIGLITSIIPWEFIAAGLGAVVALVAAWVTGRRSGAVRAKIKGLEAEDDKHRRMNDADLGLGATDDERIKRLREFAGKHGD